MHSFLVSRIRGVKVIKGFHELWDAVYPGETVFRDKTTELIGKTVGAAPKTGGNWLSRAVIYSLYVDHFNGTIAGLTEKLPYLEDLGVNCLHLLPVLDSPMLDAGFDIRSYRHIRPELSLSNDPDAEFDNLLTEARSRDIRIIFDIALNHCSSEHPWFLDARASRDSQYRDFFIWSDTPEKYSDARIIFKGLCASNWQYDEGTGQYYFHRFFPIQPDLNYRNPRVLFEMISILLSWLDRGIDGFRADAIPYLWKEEGTSCENLSETHALLKIFRYALEAVKPGTLFLAEANQRPGDVVEYLRTEDECNAAYHFPLMPQVFKALATGDGSPVRDVLSPAVTPDIPDSASWVTFLRCHDELTLEMVTPQDRKLIFNHYARRHEWDFRQGEGIAGRLFTLLEGDTDLVLLAFTIMFTLPGTPVIYYGDEVAEPNNTGYWGRQRERTGYNDSRYLNRGPLAWDKIESGLRNPESPVSTIWRGLTTLIGVRREEPSFIAGSLEFSGTRMPGILAYDRTAGDSRCLVRCNLGRSPVSLDHELYPAERSRVLFARGLSPEDGRVFLRPRGVVVAAVGGGTQ